MSESKSFIDNLFDAADAALTPLEKVLARDPAPQKQDPNVIDAEFEDHKDNRKEDWEKSFKVTHWAAVVQSDKNKTSLGTAWHAFDEGSVHPKCDPKLDLDTSNRQVLEHGKFITACSSCIIAVSK